MNRPARLKTAIAATVLAMLMGGCATDGTGGTGGTSGFHGGYYDDYWYGYGYGVVVDNPGDIGSAPRPEHPIAMPPGSQPRPEHPIATPARGSSFGGGFGGGGRGGGGGRR